MNKSVKGIIEAAYGKEIAVALLSAYSEVVNYWLLGKYKVSELDAGHFIEAARRIIEFETTGTYTPFGQDLPKFHEGTLGQYSAAQLGGETFRLLIPRALWSAYTIRNKRGVAHSGKISANEMDATFMLAAVKWVLSEIVREKSQLSIPETTKLVSDIVERQLEILWKDDTSRRVLDTTLSAKDQVLVLLYDQSPSSEEGLRSSIEYENASDFRSKVLKDLHTKRLIEFRASEKLVFILPPGIDRAEQIILRSKALKP